MAETGKILKSLKPNVCDIFSCSPNHLLQLGEAGWELFMNLVNVILSDISLTSLPEINSTWSIVLYKGHNRPKNSTRSYRCISSSTLIARFIDSLVGQQVRHGWDQVKSRTQFMSRGSSHELTVLLITELSRFSLISQKPLYSL